MKLYISTDTNSFVQDPLFPAPVQSVAFKRGDSATVELIFVSNNTSLSAISGRDITFGIKESGKYDGPYIVAAEDYTISGDSYILNPNFNTVALNTLLNHGDSDDTNDVASVTLMLEVTWSDNATDFYSTNTIQAIVSNDVNKGGETSPIASQTLVEWLEEYRPLPLSLSSAPVNSGVIVDPSGDDNSVWFTLKEGISAATVTYDSVSATAYKEGVLISGDDVTVIPAAKARMIVAAASATNFEFMGDPKTPEPVLYLAPTLSLGFPKYTNTGTDGPFTDSVSRISYGGHFWSYTAASVTFFSDQNVASPELCTDWYPNAPNSTGTFLGFSTGVTSASQVVKTVNATLASPISATLVATGLSAIDAVASQDVLVGTSGKLDQNAIVNDTDVYKCIKDGPYKWVKLN